MASETMTILLVVVIVTETHLGTPANRKDNLTFLSDFFPINKIFQHHRDGPIFRHHHPDGPFHPLRDNFENAGVRHKLQIAIPVATLPMIVVDSTTTSEGLPSNVDSMQQLDCLPAEYLSDDPARPLLYTDSYDLSRYTYSLKPTLYSVIFVLLIELLEGFSFYGIEGTETPYLLGQYNDYWNANLTDVQAYSFVSGGTAVAAATPFVGGIIADAMLGEYLTIVFGTALFYIPGLLLLALTAVPYLLGPTFSVGALKASMLFFFPAGVGLIKSVVNVFGARQYHPILQADLIQSYYVNFFLAENIGALAGGILIPILAQANVSVAYMIPACTLTLGLICFLTGTTRYVRAKPRRDKICRTLRMLGSAAVCQPRRSRESPTTAASLRSVLPVIPISALIIPLSLVYFQMITVFSVQGMAMRSAGFVDSSIMLNFDSISILVVGFLVGNYLYPYLSRRGIHLATTTKFAIGTFFGACAVLASIIIDYAIHQALSSGDQISILWQMCTYILIGAGEFFTVTTVYDVVFTIAPTEQKCLASALNLFLIGALPNFLAIGLYNACAPWFPGGSGANLDLYEKSQVYKYLWVVFGISILGVIVNLLPPVMCWVERVYENADDERGVPDRTKATANSIPDSPYLSDPDQKGYNYRSDLSTEESGDSSDEEYSV